MKHKIRKNISRKINTGSYENITISVDIEKEIECSEEDFATESEKITRIVTDDFKNTLTQVMDELKLSEKKAWGDAALDKKSKLSDSDMKDILGE